VTHKSPVKTTATSLERADETGARVTATHDVSS
jgi:hypothetical protein